MVREDPRFKSIEVHVKVFEGGAQFGKTDTGLPRWTFADRVIWFEDDDGKLRLKARAGSGLVTEIRDDPREKHLDDDILAHDPADIAALIADALVDPMEPGDDGPQALD
jgi:hypothetical protein